MFSQTHMIFLKSLWTPFSAVFFPMVPSKRSSMDWKFAKKTFSLIQWVVVWDKVVLRWCVIFFFILLRIYLDVSSKNIMIIRLLPDEILSVKVKHWWKIAPTKQISFRILLDSVYENGHTMQSVTKSGTKSDPKNVTKTLKKL